MTCNITQQIEDRLKENKGAVKTYASHAFANSKGENLGADVKKYYGTEGDIRYMTVYLPSSKRWTVVFLFGEYMNRNKIGGYVGYISDKGFWSI